MLLKAFGITLLCDPWVSESGAFLHTWLNIHLMTLLSDKPCMMQLPYGKELQLIAQVKNVMREAENETILVKDEFEDYQVQRYCPHAGADLSHAKIPRWQINLSKASMSIRSSFSRQVYCWQQYASESL